MSIKSTDLKIYQKAEILYSKCIPVLKRFPKYEKFELSRDIRTTFNNLAKSIVLANEIKHKRKIYQDEIDGYLALLIVFFNRARMRKYITPNLNLKIQASVEEIGRMLGGWKKSNYKK